MPSRRVRQAATLTAANLAVIALGFALSVLLSHVLSAQDYGSYRWIVTMLNAAAVICQLGLPYAASVALAREDDPLRIRSLVSSMALALLGVGAVGSFILAPVLAGLGDRVPALAPIAAMAAPLVLLQSSMATMLNGVNDVRRLALQMVLAPTVLMVGLASAILIGHPPLPLWLALAFFVAGYVVAQAFSAGAYWTSPDWRQDFSEVRSLLATTGRPVYLGTLMATATTHMLSLLLGGMIGMNEYAVYALAVSFAQPTQLLPSVLGTVMFRSSARAHSLPRRVIRLTILLALTVLGAYLIALWVAFPLLLPATYRGSLAYAMALAAAFTMFGVGDFFNRFVGAKGHGRIVMGGAVLSGLTNILVTLALIPQLQAWGAVVGLACAAATYLLAMVLGYRRVTRRSKSAESHQVEDEGRDEPPMKQRGQRNLHHD